AARSAFRLSKLGPCRHTLLTYNYLRCHSHRRRQKLDLSMRYLQLQTLKSTASSLANKALGSLQAQSFRPLPSATSGHLLIQKIMVLSQDAALLLPSDSLVGHKPASRP